LSLAAVAQPPTPNPNTCTARHCGQVLEGFGRLLVLAIGPNSQQGLINAAVIAGKGSPAPGAGGAAGGAAAALRQQTALSAKLEQLAHTIGRLGMAAAAGTLLYNCALQTADLAAAGRLAAPWAMDAAAIDRYLDFLITSITLLVVSVPEGLPLAVTLALAFSVARMLQDNNLVRHLDACETMAGCTTICRWAFLGPGPALGGLV
jgi:Ca2+ transporting ATPase